MNHKDQNYAIKSHHGRLLGRLLFFISIAFLSLNLIGASSKKNISCLDKIVLFKQDDRILGTGFITMVDGKKVAVSFINTLRPNMRILDLNDKILEYNAVLFPEEKNLSRNLIFYKFSDQESQIPFLELETNILTNISIGEKIFVFGCVQGTKTITQDKAKVVGIGPQNIETNSNISTDIEGGPLISAETEKALGIVRCQKNTLKKNAEFIPYAVRFDNIEKYEEYSLEELASDLTELQNIAELCGLKRTNFEKLRREIYYLSENINNSKIVSLSKINNIEARVKNAQNEIPALLNSLSAIAKKIKIPQIKIIAEHRISITQPMQEDLKIILDEMKTLRENYHTKQNTKKRDKETFLGDKK